MWAFEGVSLLREVILTHRAAIDTYRGCHAAFGAWDGLTVVVLVMFAQFDDGQIEMVTTFGIAAHPVGAVGKVGVVVAEIALA